MVLLSLSEDSPFDEQRVYVCVTTVLL